MARRLPPLNSMKAFEAAARRIVPAAAAVYVVATIDVVGVGVSFPHRVCVRQCHPGTATKRRNRRTRGWWVENRVRHHQRYAPPRTAAAAATQHHPRSHGIRSEDNALEAPDGDARLARLTATAHGGIRQ